MQTVLQLKLPRKQRIVVIGLFGAGFLACAAGLVRIAFTWLMTTATNHDKTWNAWAVWIASGIELYVGIVRIPLGDFIYPCICTANHEDRYALPYQLSSLSLRHICPTSSMSAFVRTSLRAIPETRSQSTSRPVSPSPTLLSRHSSTPRDLRYPNCRLLNPSKSSTRSPPVPIRSWSKARSVPSWDTQSRSVQT